MTARPCQARHPRPEETRESCHLCWLYCERPDYRALWDGAVAAPTSVPPVPQPLTLPCMHEGAVLEWCHTCGGEWRHVRECDLHDRCTRGWVSDAVRSCRGCPDYAHAPETPGSGLVREPSGG